MADAGIARMSTLHRRMGMSRHGLDRVVVQGAQPGARFIGSLCSALGKSFDELFEIVPRHRKR